MQRMLSYSLAAALASVLGCGGGPDCNNACHTAGATQCSGTQVQTCKADANGCLSLTPAVACGAGLFCNSATSACAPCVNTCTLGARQCSGTQIQTCNADVNGCLALSAPAACPAGALCDSTSNVCLAQQAACPQAPTIVTSSVAPPDPGPACRLPIAPSALTANVQPLGTRTVGDVVNFTVPPGTGGFSIVSQAVSASGDITVIDPQNGNFTLPNSVVPEFVHEPNGNLFYNDTVNPPADPSTALAAYGGLSPSTGAFTVPNTTAALNAFASGVPAGTWNFTVGDFGLECSQIGPSGCTGGSTTSTYDITVLTHPAVGAIGTIDVGIYLVSALFPDAATAAANAGVKRLVSTLQTFYGRAGLCLGKVTLYDVPAWAKARFATGVSADATGPCSELDQMFTLSAPVNELSLFFVDDIAQSSGDPNAPSVVGIDGTIPGPATFGGTVHSGAAVNAANLTKGTCSGPPDVLTCGADVTAYIAAHEGGHFMGLYHTTESVGAFFDPVADTGQCVCTQCVPVASVASCLQNNPSGPLTTVKGADCNRVNCDGAQYLMFWLIDEVARVGNISAQQAQIIRANPVVR